MRLFLAVELAQDVKDSLEEAIRSLRETRAPVRWVVGEGLHLTLKFLGETSQEKAEELSAAVEDVCRSLPPFGILLEGMGAFPQLSRPRVVWVGVEEATGTLRRLWGELERVAESCGWERERRGFSPHVTLGRVKGNVNLKRLAEAIEGLRKDSWGRQECPEVILFRSHLEPGGARYEVVRRFRLGG